MIAYTILIIIMGEAFSVRPYVCSLTDSSLSADRPPNQLLLLRWTNTSTFNYFYSIFIDEKRHRAHRNSPLTSTNIFSFCWFIYMNKFSGEGGGRMDIVRGGEGGPGWIIISMAGVIIFSNCGPRFT